MMLSPSPETRSRGLQDAHHIDLVGTIPCRSSRTTPHGRPPSKAAKTVEQTKAEVERQPETSTEESAKTPLPSPNQATPENDTTESKKRFKSRRSAAAAAGNRATAKSGKRIR
ncbi:unnamed protein product [Microthlaspi erraticum]|uniref:Uncharacterized protein n=1 Tax=Microthlaspi erraticum TaxID=1685480 RepID=A0A6D2HLP2_9BRAS|nr:unnamed protein product [Microthlaspi erraticum]CAA7017941.1 unnamed protein product [Microthlaspi erraticum]CAA7059963.1 unnamed protein product [Microthlaspi erraticum]